MNFYLFALFNIEGKVSPDVVARNLAMEVGVEFAFSSVGFPIGLGGHGALLLPKTALLGTAVDAQHEVEGIDGLGIVVAKGAEEFAAFDFGVAHVAHSGAALVGQAFAQVEQHIGPTFGKGEAGDGTAERGRHLGEDAVFREAVAVVAGMRHLVGVGRSIVFIVRFEVACRGHQQERTHVGAAYTAEIDVAESGEEAVGVVIGRGPPAGVFVVAVQVAPHHVEGRHAHQPCGEDSTGVTRPEVGRTDEGIDVVDEPLRGLSRCYRGKRASQQKNENAFHFRETKKDGVFRRKGAAGLE